MAARDGERFGGERTATLRHVTAASASTQLRRLGPPRLDRGQLLRPRLISRLRLRFDRRATLVIGGPGFGKSTLMAQAMNENRVAPLGADHWLSCTRHDAVESTFLQAVFSASQLPSQAGGPPSTVAELLGALARLAPGSCLVLDDVHELPDGSPGHRALQALISGLPAQCSILLGSRTMPDVPLAVWRSRGEVESISEDDLRFTEDELSIIGRERRSADRALTQASNGGWPALVELELATGREGSDAYLREAVLAAATPDEQRLIAVLDAIGGGDRQLAAAAASTDVSDALWRRVTAFPMLQPVDGDGFRPHGLWARALESVLDDDERRSARIRAAETLRSRGRHDDAFRLFAAVEDWHGCRSVVTDACSTGCTQVGLPTIERWSAAFPPSESDHPEVELLRGLAARDGRTFDTTTLDLLQSAADGFRTAGLVGPEAATLAEIGFVAREQGREEVFAGVVTRLFELAAAGHSQVQGLLHLGAAIFAETADDDEANLRELLAIEPTQVSVQLWSRIDWLRGHAELMLGRPERAKVYAQRSVDAAEAGFLGGRYLDAYLDWWCQPTARVVAALPDIWTEAGRTPFDEVYGGGVLSAVHAFCGHVDIARRGLEVAKGNGNDAFRSHLRPEYRGVLAVSEAAVLVAEGDDDGARRVLRTFFERFPVDGPDGRRLCRRFPGLVHVLIPEVRPAIDAADYGPAMARARTAARWFELLEQHPQSAADIDLSSILPLVNVLPLRWCVIALARLANVDLGTAKTVTEDLVGVCGHDVRILLRSEWARAERSGDTAVADGARRLLGIVPIAPPTPLRIDLLGPLRVSGHVFALPASAAVVEQELRRERVRQLIVLLAVRRQVRRDEVAADLWPELDTRRSSQNLRTTLTYVNRALEPERDARDAAFVLRANGDTLSLVSRPWVETDLEQFDELLLNADDARSDGVHTLELEQLEQALALVRGEPLVDVLYEEWAAPYVRRVHASIAFATRRAAELCFAQERFRDVERYAAMCLTVEPYDEAAHRFAVAAPLRDGRLAAAQAALRAWAQAHESLGIRPTGDFEMLQRRLKASSQPAILGEAVG